MFKDSLTIPEMGISEVTIQHNGKEYKGTAKKHPEDDWSEFTGCRIAETRAEIKALKEERKQRMLESEACRNLLTSCLQTKTFDKESSSAKVLFRQINVRIKRVNEITDEINSKELALEFSIKAQNKIKEKYKSKTD